MTSETHNHELNEHEQGNHDHKHCKQKAMQTAEQLCQQRGVKFTPLRRQVLTLVWESHRAVKAYDLLQKLNPAGSAAKPTTVYRALDFLLEQGLIHKVESLNAFIGCSYSEREHEQLLLTCVVCQEVEERPGEAVMQAMHRELEQADFLMRRQAIEIHGICRRCHTG